MWEGEWEYWAGEEGQTSGGGGAGTLAFLAQAPSLEPPAIKLNPSLSLSPPSQLYHIYK